MSGVAEVEGMLLSGCGLPSEGGMEDACDCERLIRVTGGGLHKSYRGSLDALRSCLVFVDAIIAEVTIAEWASKISGDRLSFSVSGCPVDHMYALRSSLPHIIY